MRGATKNPDRRTADAIISTHTPHAGRDSAVDGGVPLMANISTHTPHAGRDELNSYDPILFFDDFYSHAPCGARLRKFCPVIRLM